MKDYKNILIIKMSSLGDVIHALPTLYAIRKNWPQAKITWAVHEQFSAVLPGMPWIDEVIYIDKKKLKSFSYLRTLRRQLHDHQFDMCLDLQCLAKSAIVAFLSGAKEKYGYWELREGSKLVNKALVGPNQYGHVIERYLDTVRVLGGTVDSIEFPMRRSSEAAATVGNKLKEYSIDLKAPYIVMAPGARWAVKEWPVEQFAALVDALTPMDLPIVLVGAASDESKGKAIKELATNPKLVDFIGHTSLLELIELIGHSALYISADTGPLHMANALKVPLIALFGPTAPDRTGPYGGDYVHIIKSPTSRATVEEPLIDDPQCMAQIPVQQVADEARLILNKIKN
ncbi:glycosyltransferase family 9 protein [uncultured Veillonella sp.]|uniref:glycosyltransferase family 9 protein n=1 Tax=uncultured Veillonella sp. TaxID=159268 RepID=UPI002601F0C2|nr:glycosyltransferase family 9 protein [uncultured Veillonella sp.]